jgi:hypothetical protein
MMEKRTTVTKICRLKKCYFHYNMQKIKFALFQSTCVNPTTEKDYCC